MPDPRKLHIAVNVELRRLGVAAPACDGPDCRICALLAQSGTKGVVPSQPREPHICEGDDCLACFEEAALIEADYQQELSASSPVDAPQGRGRQEEDGLQRYSGPSLPDGPEASPLPPANATDQVLVSEVLDSLLLHMRKRGLSSIVKRYRYSDGRVVIREFTQADVEAAIAKAGDR